MRCMSFVRSVTMYLKKKIADNCEEVCIKFCHVC